MRGQARRAYARNLCLVRTTVPFCKDLACCTDLPTILRPGTAIQDHIFLVPLVEGNL